MLKPRVIPCLLLRGSGLVKTVRFRKPKYLGDPINIVRIFNEKQTDELMLLDIAATREQQRPRFDLLAEIASECFMPLGYGGGVRDLEDMSKLFTLGVEKVSVNSRAVERPAFVREAADHFGSQSIVVSIDVHRTLLGRYAVVTHSGTRRTGLNPVEHARCMEAQGAGEILLTSVDRDGTLQGYDLPLIRSVTEAVSVPVIACGGAGRLEDFSDAIAIAGAAAVAAGSVFVLTKKTRAVLVTYPEPSDLARLPLPQADVK